MRTSLAASAIALAGLVALPPRAVFAQEPSAAEKAVAEQLFQDGRQLLQEGRLAEACAKLAESERIEPKPGTLLNLAVCHEQQGKTASAWVEFREARTLSARAGNQDRVELADQHIAALEQRQSRLAIVLSVPPQGTTVALNGVTIGAAAWGTAFPVDPGPQRLEVSAPGRRTFTRDFVVPVGPSSTTIQVPALVSTAPPSGSMAPPPDEGLGAQRALGLATGGLGLVGIGLGAYFGVRALDSKSDGEAHCNGKYCDAAGLDLMDSGKSQATAATVSLAIGVALAGAGAALVITAPGRSEPRLALAPAIGPKGGGVGVGGRW